MPQPEPPPNTTRIIKVLEPSSGQYVVIVRVDPSVAARFPDKPFGHPITEIGLAQKETKKFAGYTLVSIEPAEEGGRDQLWSFQKLNGPIWPATTRSRDNLTPTKFRGNMVVVKTEQEVVPATEPSAMTGDLISSSVQRLPNTGKSVLTEITETIDVDAEPFVGQIAYEQRQIADTSEQLVVEGTPADSGLHIISSRVNPNGDGKSVKETISVPADPGWAIHTGSDWDHDLKAQIVRTEQFVAPPSSEDLALPNTSFRIINEDRSLKEVENIPTTALANFLIRYPFKVNLGDLPKELLAVNVVWNSNFSIGTQDYAFAFYETGESLSLSKSASDAASSSAGCSPEIQLTFRDVASNNLFGERLEFNLPSPITTASILAKVASIMGVSSARLWPAFRPESRTISTLGQSVSVRSNVNISLEGTYNTTDGLTSSGWDRGTSDDFQVNLNNGSVQLPPCINNQIVITGGTSRTQPVSATAFMAMSNSLVGSISAVKTTSGTAYGAVSPTVIPATTSGPKTIPTSGIYVTDMDVKSYKWDYFRVVAVVYNAANLA